MTNIDLRPVAPDDRTAPHLGPSREAWWTVRRGGVVACVALLVMVALAAFANFVVVQGMLTPDDGPATAAEIVAREGTFRLGVLAWLLIVVLDVVIAWALYRVFRPISPAVSMLAAVFRFAYAAVLLVAVGQLLRAVDVLTAGSTLAASADGVAGRALLELNAFQDLYDLGLFLFGIHLALLGYLSLRSDFIPKVVGALLVVAEPSPGWRWLRRRGGIGSGPEIDHAGGNGSQVRAVQEFQRRVSPWRRKRATPRRRPGLLTSSTPPSAIFAASDTLAVGVQRAVVDLGRRGKNVSVVGYDGIDLAVHPLISLTTVDQAGTEMGSAAVDLLMQQLQDKRTEPRCHQITPHLRVRRSSGPAKL